ncbi:hypothetical protein [Imhoffiella purpurea]|uniref:hypothetical protein n=1 Tax=Imhoffiella purpurea TaxID=1249627 RepID=UPI0005C1E986|nr:hypothetical protein [Imhoffiella purpurea]
MTNYEIPLAQAIDLWSHGQHINRDHVRALLDDGWTGEEISRMERAYFSAPEELLERDSSLDGVAVLGEE